MQHKDNKMAEEKKNDEPFPEVKHKKKSGKKAPEKKPEPEVTSSDDAPDEPEPTPKPTPEAEPEVKAPEPEKLTKDKILNDLIVLCKHYIARVQPEKASVEGLAPDLKESKLLQIQRHEEKYTQYIECLESLKG